MGKILIPALTYFICFLVLSLAAWICWMNLEEIIDRANGNYTFFSQRAWLSDNESVVYFTCWTIVFVFTGYLAIRSLIKKTYSDAIICSVYLLLLIVLSSYVERLFYNPIL